MKAVRSIVLGCVVFLLCCVSQALAQTGPTPTPWPPYDIYQQISCGATTNILPYYHKVPGDAPRDQLSVGFEDHQRYPTSPRWMVYAVGSGSSQEEYIFASSGVDDSGQSLNHGLKIEETSWAGNGPMLRITVPATLNQFIHEYKQYSVYYEDLSGDHRLWQAGFEIVCDGMPHGTPTPPPPTPTTLQMTSDRTDVCAGGWKDTEPHRGYYFLVKEKNKWSYRFRKPDPHIATMRARVLDQNGTPMAGQTVTFHWDMPGPAPEETHSKLTDVNGWTQIDVISGDELSKDYDEDGKLLFNEPVIVQATCSGLQSSKSLDVLDTKVEWQYRNEQNKYVHWNGEIFGLYSNESTVIPLKVLLTFRGVPVVGHSISWAFDGIFDKGGGPVLPSDPDYPTYGKLSGPASTTGIDGAATATFTGGYNMGQIVFAIDDSTALTQDLPPVAAAVASVRDVQDSVPSESSTMQPFASSSKKKRKPKHKVLKTKQTTEYDHVRGHANPFDDHAYPAPAGTEDGELLPDTLNALRAALGTTNETRDRERKQFGLVLPGPPRPGTWWISQAVGDDYDSFGTHYSDLSLKRPETFRGTGGKPYTKQVVRLYGAAFDLVLTQVPIFYDRTLNGRNTPVRAFYNPGQNLRAVGFIAWHRWAREYNGPLKHDKQGNPIYASIENEIHCIDPAVPIMKQYLRNQIRGYKQNLSNAPGRNGYLKDWLVTDTQFKKEAIREARSKPLLAYYQSKGIAAGKTPSGGVTPQLTDANDEAVSR